MLLEWRMANRGRGLRRVRRLVTFVLMPLLVLRGHRIAAQEPAARLTRGDSALVHRILAAEDRRDASDPALGEGDRHADARVRLISRRARGRIGDPTFAARESLPALPTPPNWAEPAWRVRYRALPAARSDCRAIRAALTDSVWPVRLRAMDVVAPACASDDTLVSALRGWVDMLPADASRRSRGGVSWQAAAHALVALARLRPVDARSRLPALASHAQWQVRMYAARAAAVLADTTTLVRLARDANDDVAEAAITGLAVVAPGDLPVFVAALSATGPPVVRAAAVALQGTRDPGAIAAATAAFARWVTRASASERDVRVALLAAAGRPAGDDQPPPLRHALAPRVVALALGADVRLRVQMSPASGSGAFVVRLRGDVAPIMAARILALVTAHYYDGLSWHRVEHDFVIQGGSPGASEYVGLPYFLRDEVGSVPHRRGTIGMSTRGHDTGDAQWFVNLKDNLRLGADYTVFAEVVQGMDVVDDVLEGDVIAWIEENSDAIDQSVKHAPVEKAESAPTPPERHIHSFTSGDRPCAT
jgi:cyclophilin family peptidyl-prolyl cis-trans isomerase